MLYFIDKHIFDLVIKTYLLICLSSVVLIIFCMFCLDVSVQPIGMVYTVLSLMMTVQTLLVMECVDMAHVSM